MKVTNARCQMDSISTFLKIVGILYKNDIVNFLSEFYVARNFPKAVKTSIFDVNPKKRVQPQELGYYHPICFNESLYKILSKLLLSKLNKVLLNIISPCQSSFYVGIFWTG